MFCLGDFVIYSEGGSTSLTVTVWNMLRSDFSPNGISAFTFGNKNLNYHRCHMAYDGSEFWVKYPYADDGGDAENYVIVPCNPRRMLRIGTNLVCDTGLTQHNPVYAVTYNDNDQGASSELAGRMVAWGPGIFMITNEEDGANLSFMPFTK